MDYGLFSQRKPSRSSHLHTWPGARSWNGNRRKHRDPGCVQCEGLVTENQVEPSNRFKKKHSILTLSVFSVNLYTFERTKMRTMKSVPLFQSNMADPIWPQFEHRDVISLSLDILYIFNSGARSIILHIRCLSKSLGDTLEKLKQWHC